jgi:hypothetical protein
MRNTGMVASAEAYVVHRNDKFFQKFGSEPQIVHEPPALGTPRGDTVGAYAIIRLTSGEVIQEVMDHDEIERIRGFSKAKDSPAWKNHWGEMARKTVLKRAAKSAPTSAEMLQLLDRDDDGPSEPGMVDITGAAHEPEPQRITQTSRSYAVVDADGEEHEFETPAAVDKALRTIFDDAKKRNGSALAAAAENNAATIGALSDDGHTELAEELTAYWRELSTDSDPFGLPPSKVEPRDPDWWARERLSIDWSDKKAGQLEMRQRLRESLSVIDVQALRDDNGEMLDALPKATRQDVLAALMDREKQLTAAAEAA